jgi:parallel beta-helix repeat protein
MKSIHVLLIAIALALIAAPAMAATLVVAESGGDYADLRAAVDAAGSGDIVEVRAGSYPGAVIVNKTLTIAGSGDDCRIGTAEDDYALIVTAEGVSLRSLNLAGSDTPLSLNAAHSTTIQDCRVEGGERGIVIADSNAVTLGDSEISADFIALEATNASQLRISGNLITGATEAIALQQSDQTTLRENRIEDCGIGVFVRESAGGVLEDTALSRVKGGVGLFMATDWEIRGSVLESVDQYLDACMSSGCSIEAASLEGTNPFASDAVSANRYTIGSQSLEGRDFSLSADDTAVPDGYVQYGEGFKVAFLDVTSTQEPVVSVEADAADLDLEGMEPATLAIYRIDAALTQVSGAYGGNGTVTAVITDGGSYALLAKEQGEEGLPLTALLIGLIAVVIVAAAFLYLRTRSAAKFDLL